MKKLTYLTAMACLSTAAAVQAANTSFTGPYVDGFVGGTFLNGHVKSTAKLTDTPDVAYVKGDNSVTNLGASAGFGVGYAYQYANHFLVGLELTASQINAEMEDPQNFNFGGGVIYSNISVKLENDFALLFKPGYVIGESALAYLLIGARWGNFETTNWLNIDDVGIPPSSITTSAYTAGVTAGVGFKQLLTDHLGVALEYAFTNYGYIEAPEYTALVSGFTFNNSPSVEANTQTLAAQLSYNF